MTQFIMSLNYADKRKVNVPTGFQVMAKTSWMYYILQCDTPVHQDHARIGVYNNCHIVDVCLSTV